MPTYFLGHVMALSEDIIGAQLIPTDVSYQEVDYDRPGIRLWLSDEGWKVKCFENYLTGDTTFPPSCFSLDPKIGALLDEGRERVRGHEGSLMHSHTEVRIQLDDVRPVRATGTVSKELKEDEAEQAIARAFDSEFELQGTFVGGVHA